MKLNIKACFIMISLSLTAEMVSANQDTISYKNSRGSTLELNFSNQDTLTGTFTTAVASKDCQDVIGLKRPITGYINGSAITFNVNYPTCGSVVTLIGHINSNKDTIDTIALIAQQSSIFTDGPGTQFLTHDTFIKENEG